MLSTIDSIGEVGGTFHILHKASGKCAISSISDETQYNYGYVVHLRPVAAGVDTNPTYNRLTREFVRMRTC